MKLEGQSVNEIYTSECRDVLKENGTESFRYCGTLPNRGFRKQSLQRLLQTNCLSRYLIARLVGPFPIVNVWPIDANLLYGSCGRSLFRSFDTGETWTRIHQFPPSSGPMGILPTGLCSTDDTLTVGEYPLDDSREPRVLQSNNRGNTWHTIETISARHIHGVTLDPYTGEYWITTGDTDQDSMIARLRKDGLEVIGTGSQLWRAVELVFTPEAVLWGMDCPYLEENRIVKLSRDQIEKSEPAVETLDTISSPVYFAETINFDGEQHVFFSTAIEPATSPEHVARVIHGSSADGFETWRTIATYNRSSPSLAGLLDTNAYIFLTAHPERGLFFNPYNTDTDSGVIRKLSLNRLRSFVD